MPRVILRGNQTKSIILIAAREKFKSKFLSTYLVAGMPLLKIKLVDQSSQLVSAEAGLIVSQYGDFQIRGLNFQYFDAAATVSWRVLLLEARAQRPSARGLARDSVPISAARWQHCAGRAPRQRLNTATVAPLRLLQRDGAAAIVLSRGPSDHGCLSKCMFCHSFLLCLHGSHPEIPALQTLRGLCLERLDKRQVQANKMSHRMYTGEEKLHKTSLDECSIPGRVTPGCSHAGIVPDDAAGRWVFSGISRLLHPFVPSCSVLISITLAGSQDLAVKSRPDLFTHSPHRAPQPSPRDKYSDSGLGNVSVHGNQVRGTRWRGETSESDTRLEDRRLRPGAHVRTLSARVHPALLRKARDFSRPSPELFPGTHLIKVCNGLQLHNGSINGQHLALPFCLSRTSGLAPESSSELSTNWNVLHVYLALPFCLSRTSGLAPESSSELSTNWNVLHVYLALPFCLSRTSGLEPESSSELSTNWNVLHVYLALPFCLSRTSGLAPESSSELSTNWNVLHVYLALPFCLSRTSGLASESSSELSTNWNVLRVHFCTHIFPEAYQTCKVLSNRSQGGRVVRLLASHHDKPGSIPGWLTTDFRKWESCLTMPLVCGFTRVIPCRPPPPVHFLSGAAHSHLASPSSALKTTIALVSSSRKRLLPVRLPAIVRNIGSPADDTDISGKRGEYGAAPGSEGGRSGRQNSPANGIVRHDPVLLVLHYRFRQKIYLIAAAALITSLAFAYVMKVALMIHAVHGRKRLQEVDGNRDSVRATAVFLSGVVDRSLGPWWRGGLEQRDHHLVKAPCMFLRRGFANAGFAGWSRGRGGAGCATPRARLRMRGRANWVARVHRTADPSRTWAPSRPPCWRWTQLSTLWPASLGTAARLAHHIPPPLSPFTQSPCLHTPSPLDGSLSAFGDPVPTLRTPPILHSWFGQTFPEALLTFYFQDIPSPHTNKAWEITSAGLRTVFVRLNDYTTRMQVDLKQGFQFYREQHVAATEHLMFAAVFARVAPALLAPQKRINAASTPFRPSSRRYLPLKELWFFSFRVIAMTGSGVDLWAFPLGNCYLNKFLLKGQDFYDVRSSRHLVVVRIPVRRSGSRQACREELRALTGCSSSTEPEEKLTSLPPQFSPCSRVLRAPSRTVGFTRRFHTLSSIQATNTSLTVDLQSPVVFHTSHHSRTLGQTASVKDCRPVGCGSASQSHQNILASSPDPSKPPVGEKRHDVSKAPISATARRRPLSINHGFPGKRGGGIGGYPRVFGSVEGSTGKLNTGSFVRNILNHKDAIFGMKSCAAQKYTIRQLKMFRQERIIITKYLLFAGVKGALGPDSSEVIHLIVPLGGGCSRAETKLRPFIFNFASLSHASFTLHVELSSEVLETH
ncbi:hypothetical protein PR048_011590 [Dryococelus australis]|uniref:Uncharacterized protein n=1 Tax=Dryococelus australis TaxID=614101 RepID=A0ABQ9HM17_9NEOP|nr:hypothetical protein PR048_011590 [Dryococelus australis]